MHSEVCSKTKEVQDSNDKRRLSFYYLCKHDSIERTLLMAAN